MATLVSSRAVISSLGCAQGGYGGRQVLAAAYASALVARTAVRCHPPQQPPALTTTHSLSRVHAV
jgi:hypothetical protein